MFRHDDKVYDCVVIMAGTNDLAERNIKIDRIVSNLDGLHKMAQATGAKTVAITVPESNAQLVLPDIGMRWESTNRKIKAHFGGRDRTLVLDSTNLVRYSHETGLWEEDGLHMTEAGYDAFGAALGGALRNFLGLPPKMSSTAPLL